MGLLDNAIIIDFEASGLTPTLDLPLDSWPTELAWGDPLTGLIGSSLVKPVPGWTHWIPLAETITGISQDLLQREGRHPNEIVNLLAQAANGRTLYCDALRFDLHWLQRLIDASTQTPRFQIGRFQELIFALACETIPADSREPMLADGKRMRLIHQAQTYANERAGKLHRAAADVRNMLVMLNFVATNGENPVIPSIDPPVV